MTQRLYYDDSYLLKFQARVVRRFETAGIWVAILDQTAFYPASGGQPHDLGRIGTARVVEVLEESSGDIVHGLDSPLPAVEQVEAEIDWHRRFDHMQQHSGQHILSQAFLKTTRFNTVGFHMGEKYVTIDLDAEEVSLDRVREAEELANSIVFENRPIRVRHVSPDKVPQLGLRQESQRDGPLRIVEIEGFDVSACGGTHVRHCGEIGGIFVRGLERVNRQVRVEFVCGRRALDAHRSDLALLESAARKFSVGLPDVPERVEKLLEEDLRVSSREAAKIGPS